MKEIGGYFELERCRRPMLHEGALALNCGRTCLEYLLEQKNIKKLALPYFMCSVVRDSCEKCGTGLSYYHIGRDFMPEDVKLREDEWLYAANFYGQLSTEQLLYLKEKYRRVIVDNAQAYFAPPPGGVDCIYTCRKFFGVPDGAFLYTDAPPRELQRDISYTRMDFVLGRFEKNAGEFYPTASANNDFFSTQPVLKMSALTENLLRAVDYEEAEKKRTENFLRLHRALGGMNELSVHPVKGAFSYPLMLDNAPELRKKLIADKIFVPTLWPNVLSEVPAGSWEYRLAANVLPLPCDQRYGAEDMDRIINFFSNVQPSLAGRHDLEVF